MRRVLDTDVGRDLYAKRRVMIEPVFANTKFNRHSGRLNRAVSTGPAARADRIAGQPPLPHRLYATATMRSASRGSSVAVGGVIDDGGLLGGELDGHTPSWISRRWNCNALCRMAQRARTG